MREPKGCRNPALIQRYRMPRRPPECTGIAFKNALIAHFVPPTETGETANQRSNCVIPAHAGTQRLSESGPHSALSDAQTPPECTGIASKRALTAHFVHSTATDKSGNHEGNVVIPAGAGMTTFQSKESCVHGCNKYDAATGSALRQRVLKSRRQKRGTAMFRHSAATIAASTHYQAAPTV